MGSSTGGEDGYVSVSAGKGSSGLAESAWPKFGTTLTTPPFHSLPLADSKIKDLFWGSFSYTVTNPVIDPMAYLCREL